jgi:hypothetical protein
LAEGSKHLYKYRLNNERSGEASGEDLRLMHAINFQTREHVKKKEKEKTNECVSVDAQ